MFTLVSHIKEVASKLLDTMPPFGFHQTLILSNIFIQICVTFALVSIIVFYELSGALCLAANNVDEY